MNLPNYFLADLPAQAVLTAATIEEACQTLKRNREMYLRDRSTRSLIRLMHGLSENWRDAEYPFRKLALEQGPRETGFSKVTLTNGLDIFFGEITGEKLEQLLIQELGGVERLDAFGPGIEAQNGRQALCVGPEMLAHIAGGRIPNPTFLSVIFGVLLKSAQFVKCPTGAAYLPRLFAHSIYDADPKLGACLEIAEWRGGQTLLEESLFKEAEAVTATGSDETLAGVRKLIPAKARFVNYGHRVSFAYVTREAVSGYSLKQLVADVVTDVVSWNQLGCLSPHVIYVEAGGAVTPEHFAQMLSGELSGREAIEPRGELPAESAAIIASKRGFYEVRAAHSIETRHWFSENSTAWTVIYEADARFQMSCLNRFVYVKSAENLGNTLEMADAVRGSVSTVALAASGEREQEIAMTLARWGVSRICPPGQMQHPPLCWRHDGRPPLGDLVTWCDWETKR